MTRKHSKSLVAAFAALVFSGHALAQDDVKKPEKQDPAVKEKAEAIEKLVADKKFEHDAEAVTKIDELAQAYATMHPKDQKLVRDTLQKVFRGKKRPPENSRLYRATIVALGQIGGPECAKILVDQLQSTFREEKDWLTVQEDILENIGKCKDPKQVEFLTDVATRDPTDSKKAAAGKALGYFSDLPLDKRQDIFKDLVIDYERIEGGANSLDTGNTVVQTLQRTLVKIRDPWNGTLGQLSGQAFGTATEWRKWWNEHKDDKKAWK